MRRECGVRALHHRGVSSSGVGVRAQGACLQGVCARVRGMKGRWQERPCLAMPDSLRLARPCNTLCTTTAPTAVAPAAPQAARASHAAARSQQKARPWLLPADCSQHPSLSPSRCPLHAVPFTPLRAPPSSHRPTPTLRLMALPHSHRALSAACVKKCLRCARRVPTAVPVWWWCCSSPNSPNSAPHQLPHMPQSHKNLCGAGADRFEGVEWFPANNECPVLKQAISYMECKVCEGGAREGGVCKPPGCQSA